MKRQVTVSFVADGPVSSLSRNILDFIASNNSDKTQVGDTSFDDFQLAGWYTLRSKAKRAVSSKDKKTPANS